MSDALYSALAAASGVVAAVAASQIYVQSSRLKSTRFENYYVERQYKKQRKHLEKLLNNVDVSVEQKARIKVLLAEADIYRASGLEERAQEREAESSRIVRASSSEEGEMR
ncbi:hypothetical protein [Streptomyces sp. NBC_00687]|uniref:hypothetical protein n=1 Tax=Streptomyces sp. NBC_00687 TaxID=2975807 RepID=UPI00225AF297|nr:hypothetical protein [Streptomyces sp. NBC_00687]MCX4920220.1 hypothetical protein [Streptomyces sp. NBC_00687]